MQKVTLDPKTSYVEYYSELPQEIQWSLEDFVSVWDQHPEEHGKFSIYGKEIDIPRWQKVYLHDYSFSKVKHKADNKVPAPVEKLLKWVHTQGEDKTVNGIIVNWYQNGHHYIGWHKDDTKQLIKESRIWSFSFGQEREFSLKSVKTDKVNKFKMSNNSLIVMCGTLQETHKHAVLKVNGKKGEKLGHRINVTFRSFKK